MGNYFFFFLLLVGGSFPFSFSSTNFNLPTDFSDQNHYREMVKEMFYHTYDSYMNVAFPYDEIRPISCQGKDTIGGYSLTLIDALDTLVVLGNCSEFLKRAEWAAKTLSLRIDRNVSVFETNIRVLGGLLSAYYLQETICPPKEGESFAKDLLRLCIELGDALSEAFNTKTGMPFGTVNLKKGVPPNETPITASSCIGSYTVEFGYLSYISQNPRYANLAKKAVSSLFQQRDSLGLVHFHIDTSTGKWTDDRSGIGSYVDSFVEYLLKSWIMFGDPDYWKMFQDVYSSIIISLADIPSGWYHDLSSNTHISEFDSLAAFWPGMQTLLGDIALAEKTMSSIFEQTWMTFGCIPEKYDWNRKSIKRDGYPLRPEVAESLFYLYQTTKDPIYRKYGAKMIDDINNNMRAKCGFASVIKIETMELWDHMESFILSETLKYLYLLFEDENHWAIKNNIIFSTEAHIFPVLSSSSFSSSSSSSSSFSSSSSSSSSSSPFSSLFFPSHSSPPPSPSLSRLSLSILSNTTKKDAICPHPLISYFKLVSLFHFQRTPIDSPSLSLSSLSLSLLSSNQHMKKDSSSSSPSSSSLSPNLPPSPSPFFSTFFPSPSPPSSEEKEQEKGEEKNLLFTFPPNDVHFELSADEDLLLELEFSKHFEEEITKQRNRQKEEYQDYNNHNNNNNNNNNNNMHLNMQIDDSFLIPSLSSNHIFSVDFPSSLSLLPQKQVGHYLSAQFEEEQKAEEGFLRIERKKGELLRDVGRVRRSIDREKKEIDEMLREFGGEKREEEGGEEREEEKNRLVEEKIFQQLVQERYHRLFEIEEAMSKEKDTKEEKEEKGEKGESEKRGERETERERVIPENDEKDLIVSLIGEKREKYGQKFPEKFGKLREKYYTFYETNSLISKVERDFVSLSSSLSLLKEERESLLSNLRLSLSSPSSTFFSVEREPFLECLAPIGEVISDGEVFEWKRKSKKNYPFFPSSASILIKINGNGCHALPRLKEMKWLKKLRQMIGKLPVIFWVERGVCSFAEKIENIQQTGAKGIIISNNNPGSFRLTLLSPPQQQQEKEKDQQQQQQQEEREEEEQQKQQKQFLTCSISQENGPLLQERLHRERGGNEWGILFPEYISLKDRPLVLQPVVDQLFGPPVLIELKEGLENIDVESLTSPSSSSSSSSSSVSPPSSSSLVPPVGYPEKEEKKEREDWEYREAALMSARILLDNRAKLMALYQPRKELSLMLRLLVDVRTRGYRMYVQSLVKQ